MWVPDNLTVITLVSVFEMSHSETIEYPWTKSESVHGQYTFSLELAQPPATLLFECGTNEFGWRFQRQNVDVLWS